MYMRPSQGNGQALCVPMQEMEEHRTQMLHRLNVLGSNKHYWLLNVQKKETMSEECCVFLHLLTASFLREEKAGPLRVHGRKVCNYSKTSL